MDDQMWREKLTEEQYRVLRLKGTERPFTGVYNDFFEDGVYKCAGCGSTLFTSESKFPSHCGWPSYDASVDGAITEVMDYTHNMIRKEIVCSSCGGHIGHVFDDGPTQTGLRYCVNSVSVDFEKK